MIVNFATFDADVAPAKYFNANFDGVRLKIYNNAEPHVPGGVFFDCDLCGEEYAHWWCHNRAWRCLPPQVQDKTICLACFGLVRRLRKLGAFE